MSKPVVLVVDDRPNMLRLLSSVLSRSARVVQAGGMQEALDVLGREEVALVVCDLKMPDGDGLSVLRAVKARSPETLFLLMTAYASVATAVQAMREGASDYITKPFHPDELLTRVEQALAALPARRQVEAAAGGGLGSLLGQSPPMRELFRALERVAPTDTPVLLVGEPGTGKELAARTLHELSPRRAGPFVALRTSATPRALLESELFGRAPGTGAGEERAGAAWAARSGTLFLEDVSELRPEAQARLSRLLESRRVSRMGEAEERAVDLRLVASTQRDLRSLLEAGALRQELWLALSVCPLTLPPLRERREDIALLAGHFLSERARVVSGQAASFAPGALERLAAHDWPGNVRELRSVVERAALAETTAVVRAVSLPPELRGEKAPEPEPDEVLASMTLKGAIEYARGETNRRYLELVLRKFQGDVAAAADHAGVERESFYRLLRRYGLSASAFRAPRS